MLHADNGCPMKGATLLATLQRLGVVPSFSRPGVDNPFSEALFLASLAKSRSRTVAFLSVKSNSTSYLCRRTMVSAWNRSPGATRCHTRRRRRSTPRPAPCEGSWLVAGPLRGSDMSPWTFHLVRCNARISRSASACPSATDATCHNRCSGRAPDCAGIDCWRGRRLPAPLAASRTP